MAGVSVLLLITLSCKKEAGIGGNSSLYGKVIVKDYNSTFTVLQVVYNAEERDVYIIYGYDKSYSDRTRTSYDGTYEFRYLRPGDYHIFVYSKDSTLQTNAMIPVIKDVSISKKHQDIEVPTMIVFE